MKVIVELRNDLLKQIDRYKRGVINQDEMLKEVNVFCSVLPSMKLDYDNFKLKIKEKDLIKTFTEIERKNDYTKAKDLRNQKRELENKVSQKNQIKELLDRCDKIDKSKWSEDRVLVYYYLKTGEKKHIDKLIRKNYDFWVGYGKLLSKNDYLINEAVQESIISFVEQVDRGGFKIDKEVKNFSITAYVKVAIKRKLAKLEIKSRKEFYIDDFVNLEKINILDES